VRILWSDRASWLKVGLVLTAVAGLCWEANRRLGPGYPSLGRIREYPEETQGQTAQIPPSVVREGGTDRFVLERDEVTLVVHARGRWNAGEIVAVRGRAEKGELIAEMVRPYPGYRWKRGLVYGFSLLAALFVAWRLLRRTDLARGIFESRY